MHASELKREVNQHRTFFFVSATVSQHFGDIIIFFSCVGIYLGLLSVAPVIVLDELYPKKLVA